MTPDGTDRLSAVAVVLFLAAVAAWCCVAAAVAGG